MPDWTGHERPNVQSSVNRFNRIHRRFEVGTPPNPLLGLVLARSVWETTVNI